MNQPPSVPKPTWAQHIAPGHKQSVWWWDWMTITCNPATHEKLAGPMPKAVYEAHTEWDCEATLRRFRPSAVLTQHCGDTHEYLQLREEDVRARGDQKLVDQWHGAFLTVSL